MPLNQEKSEQLHNFTAHKQNQLIRAREISAVELVQLTLNRIEKFEPQLNAFILPTPESALKAAELADLRFAGDGPPPGPLTGIPFLIKDNISTCGISTTAGSKILQGYIPPYDSEVVSRLKKAGAVIVGKGNLDEFAMGSSNESSFFGPVHNPWSKGRVPGGSSGGAAAAVSAGECTIALGSDTGGSIRQPASFCGTVGMKPTYGLVSRYGLIAFASSLDQIGPIARDVEDCASTLDIISGRDQKDSTSVDTSFDNFSSDLNTGIRGLKLGVPKEYLVDGIEPGVRQAFEKALSTLESEGAEIEETSLPMTDHALAVYYIIAPSEASANLSRYDGVKYGLSMTRAKNSSENSQETRGEGFGPEVKRRILIGTYALSAGYYDAYYKKAQQVRTMIRVEFANAFSKFDALITPTSPTVAFEIGERTNNPIQMYLSDVCTIPVNIAGLPAISVPCGFSKHLPIGLQIIGPHFGDPTVLRIANAYEKASGWKDKHPKIEGP